MLAATVESAMPIRTLLCAPQEESAISKWCAFDLFVSKDFGRHWTNLTTASGGRVASFWDFDWGANVARWQQTELGFKDETGACLKWAGAGLVIGQA